MTKTPVNKPTTENTVALLLAGGRATRMGGVNKGLVPFAGEPMAGRIIRTLRTQGLRVAVSANRDAEEMLALGAEKVVADRIEGYPGPLAALDAAGAALPEAEWFMTVPCDVPLISDCLFNVFVKGWEEEPSAAVTVHADGRDQNTVALVHRSVLASIRPFIEGGDRKLGLWFEKAGRTRLPWPDAGDAFCNVNSFEELTELERKSGS